MRHMWGKIECPLSDRAVRAIVVFHFRRPVAFRKHRQTRFFHREAGGQLFAILDGASIVVIEATPVLANRTIAQRSYVPNRKAEKEEIAEQQRRGHFFVGDWHTHPEVIAKPSPTGPFEHSRLFRQSVHITP